MLRPAARLASLTLLAALALLGGCSPRETTSPAQAAAEKIDIPPKLWEQFSGEKALEEVARQVGFGPRPSGSAALKQAREHIIATLKERGWDVELQEFEETPVAGRGAIRFANVIGRFSAKGARPASRETQRVVIGSHYDTKRMDGVRFVGANDGGSSTGALLELARVLATAPALAERVELVFFDGEEALVQFGPADSGPDGLVGSRHYARSLRNGNRAAQFRFAIVWDMIGDKDLDVTLPTDTPPALAAGLFTAAEALGTRNAFGYFREPVLDDHTPLQVISRIPAMDIIDFDYLPWHTSGDTMDKLSASSLQTVGRATIWLLVREFGK